MTRKKQLRKFIICMLCVICTLVTFTPVNTNATTKVTLSNTKITLKLGNIKVLKLKNAKGKITWKTSNTKVVSIKKKDATSITLTPKKQGNVIITATNNKKAYTCKVNVPKMKYDTWEDETVMLGYTNTVWEENPSSTMLWSIEDESIASIKTFGKKNSKCKIEALTHGETSMKIVDGGVTHIMKVIVPKVKLDVAKVVWDCSKTYKLGGGTSRCEYRTYYDDNGNDITNTLPLIEIIEGNRQRDSYESRTALGTQFIGTNISTNEIEWTSSDPDAWIVTKFWDDIGSQLYYVPYGNDNWYKAAKGSVTFTGKLGNETFSFVVEYDMCELPHD